MVRPTQFEIEEESVGTAVKLSVTGELDLGTAVELARSVEGKLREGLVHVTLDLRDLTFMDSSGLRLLIELNQRAGEESWRLALIAPEHESAKMVLRLTGADAALPFENPSR